MPLRFFAGGWVMTVAILAMGCSSIVNPDQGRLGGDFDAGARADATVVLMDSGPGIDTGVVTPDSGPVTCAGGAEPRCEGDNLVSCISGMEVRQDCRARRAYCDDGECRDWVCPPSSRMCTEDLRGVEVCTVRGDAFAVTTCTGSVCNPSTNACSSTPPMCPGLPTVAVGDTHMIDLCAQTNDNTFVPMGECGGGDPATAESGDAVFALTITTPTDVVIELSDVDTVAAIDTIVYLRRACDVPASQIACDDDEPCDSTFPIPGICTGGVDVRVSRIRTRLEPGTYYVVVDAFLYVQDRTRYGCGTARLRVTSG
jgi:hypothetical protein